MTRERILVAQSYFLRFDPKLLEAGEPVPPLGSLVFAAVLREKGFDVRFFDAMLASSEAQCGAAMDRARPHTLALFEDSFNYLTKMCLGRMRQAAVRMIRMARDRGIRVVVAGSDASHEPQFYLQAGAGAVATGEGEFSISEWLSSPGASAGSIPGIVTLGEDGCMVFGKARPPVRDLDSIPSPAWDLIDISAYRSLWMERHHRFSLPLATSRGCPFHCNWCAKPIWGQQYNAMSPARAALEVATLKRLGADHVNILDDIFGLKPDWMEVFAREVRRLDSALPFKCLSRADLLTDDRISALGDAGCEMVWIGAESGSQQILDAMEKGTTVEEIRSAATILKKRGIKLGLFLQFGYPGETAKDVEATLELVDDVLPDDIGISVSYPLPGTRFHARVDAEIGESTHWSDSSDLAMLFAGRQGTRYYRRLHAHAHARFRLARALRASSHPASGRALQVVRHWFARAVTGARLTMAGRDRIQLRGLAPELPRERAATPGTSRVSGSSGR